MLLLTRDLFVYSYNYNITYTLTTSLTCMSKTIYFWYLGFSGLFCWQENFADSQRREFPVSLKVSWGRNHYFSLSSRTRSGKTRKLQQGVRLLIWDSHFDSRCIFHILNDSALSVLFFLVLLSPIRHTFLYLTWKYIRSSIPWICLFLWRHNDITYKHTVQKATKIEQHK